MLYIEKKRAVDEKSKDDQLEMFREDPEREFLTTNQGVRVSNTDISLKAGERGPTLLEDFHFREKLLILTMNEYPKELFMPEDLEHTDIFRYMSR